MACFAAPAVGRVGGFEMKTGSGKAEFRPVPASPPYLAHLRGEVGRRAGDLLRDGEATASPPPAVPPAEAAALAAAAEHPRSSGRLSKP